MKNSKIQKFLLIILMICSNACTKTTPLEILTIEEKNLSIQLSIPIEGVEVRFYNFSFNGRVEANSNYLSFKDSASFYKVLNSLIKSKPEEIREWNQKIGFQSLQNIYDIAVLSERKEMEKEGEISDLQRNRLITYGCLSDFTFNHRYLFKFDKEKGMDMKLFNPSLAPLLNIDGIVQVGQNIFQYGEDFVKIITDGDINKVNHLYKFTKSDKSQNIVVCLVNNRMKESSVPTNGKVEDWVRSCETTVNSPASYRTLVYEEFYDYTNYTGIHPYYNPYSTYTHFIKVRNLKRGFLGYWYDTDFLTTMYGAIAYSSLPSAPNQGAYYGQVNDDTIYAYFLSNLVTPINAIPQGTVITGSHTITAAGGQCYFPLAYY
ncbi:hypothetical protein SAMN04488541_104922 [Thermoflexibacter ruber]|uniref:Uncharacterized protein n=2 Tax=Thermoflexibacter ruber TaxID=1003 RepID=A0A1I2JGB6_9BACT|nr:hypothetical protein SAMN04488541_104922 [Thermoflexibacter ruber]